MGQKVHPEGFRVGYIHDWKSNWFNEREFADYLHEDIRDPRSHRAQAQPRRAFGHHDPQGQERGDGGHPHRPAGHRDRQVRRRGGRAAPRAAPDDEQAGARQHPRGQAAGARRQARRPVDRRAAPEPRRLPARDEARDHVGDALGREGREGAGVRAGSAAPRWRGPRATPKGRVPLHTLRADIDYGIHEARTTFGRIGVKCWINKGEVMPVGYGTQRRPRPSLPSHRPRRRGGGRQAGAAAAAAGGDGRARC